MQNTIIRSSGWAGWLLPAALVLSGCQAVNEGRDILEGLTNPLVVQALALGVELPEDAQGVTLPPEFSDGATATAFLADAGNAAELENAPISGATVTLQAEELEPTAPGSYSLSPGILPYDAGEAWSFSATINDSRAATATVNLAPAADYTLPTDLTAEEGFDIDLTGQGFTGTFIVVTDSDGETTYDNRPTDIQGFYDLTQGDDVTVVQVPGTAFPEAGVYLVGVAGIETTSGRDTMERMNTALSSMMSGNLTFDPIVVQ